MLDHPARAGRAGLHYFSPSDKSVGDRGYGAWTLVARGAETPQESSHSAHPLNNYINTHESSISSFHIQIKYIIIVDFNRSWLTLFNGSK